MTNMEHVQHSQRNDKKNVLHVAVELNRPREVERLLKEGADIEAVDERGFTPLHYAVENILPNIVKSLIKEGANVFAESNDKRTPIKLIPVIFERDFKGAHGDIYNHLHHASKVVEADAIHKCTGRSKTRQSKPENTPSVKYNEDGYTPRGRVEKHLTANKLSWRNCAL